MIQRLKSVSHKLGKSLRKNLERADTAPHVASSIPRELIGKSQKRFSPQKIMFNTLKKKSSPRTPKMNSTSAKQIDTTTTQSSEDIPNLDYIVACLKKFDDNYVYTGYVTNEPQKHLDCLSDAFDY